MDGKEVKTMRKVGVSILRKTISRERKDAGKKGKITKKLRI